MLLDQLGELSKALLDTILPCGSKKIVATVRCSFFDRPLADAGVAIGWSMSNRYSGSAKRLCPSARPTHKGCVVGAFHRCEPKSQQLGLERNRWRTAGPNAFHRGRQPNLDSSHAPLAIVWRPHQAGQRHTPYRGGVFRSLPVLWELRPHPDLVSMRERVWVWSRLGNPEIVWWRRSIFHPNQDSHEGSEIDGGNIPDSRRRLAARGRSRTPTR